MGGPVMKQVLLGSAVAVVSLLASAPAAVAADQNVWVGRDLNNSRVIWTCSRVSRNDWKLKKNGATVGDYEGVTSTSEFVELQLKGSRSYDRVRLYKDHLSLNRQGSRTQWVEMAKGKWSN